MQKIDSRSVKYYQNAAKNVTYFTQNLQGFSSYIRWFCLDGGGAKKTVQTKFALYKTQTSQLYKTIVPKYKNVGS